MKGEYIMYKVTMSSDRYDYSKIMKEEKTTMLKQKLTAIGIIAFSIISVPLLDMDATAAAFFIPVGIFLLTTKQVFIDF